MPSTQRQVAGVRLLPPRRGHDSGAPPAPTPHTPPTHPARRLAAAQVELCRAPSSLSVQRLSDCLSALARLGRRPEPVWLAVVMDATTDRLEEQGNPQALTRLLWALSKLQVRPGGGDAEGRGVFGGGGLGRPCSLLQRPAHIERPALPSPPPTPIPTAPCLSPATPPCLSPATPPGICLGRQRLRPRA